jgi:hypothetical protein
MKEAAMVAAKIEGRERDILAAIADSENGARRWVVPSVPRRSQIVGCRFSSLRSPVITRIFRAPMAEELQFKCEECGKPFEPNLLEAQDDQLVTVNRVATSSILVCRKCLGKHG